MSVPGVGVEPAHLGIAIGRGGGVEPAGIVSSMPKPPSLIGAWWRSRTGGHGPFPYPGVEPAVSIPCPDRYRLAAELIQQALSVPCPNRYRHQRLAEESNQQASSIPCPDRYHHRRLVVSRTSRHRHFHAQAALVMARWRRCRTSRHRQLHAQISLITHRRLVVESNQQAWSFPSRSSRVVLQHHLGSQI